jgi:hypothetical protein
VVSRRLDRLLADLIVGWTDARRTADLAAQEALRRAAGTARHDADGGPWFSPAAPAGNEPGETGPDTA